MRQRDTLLKGGNRGPAIVPGDAESSLLFQAVSQKASLKMPVGQPPLSTGLVETLRNWIDQGAQWGSSDIHMEQKTRSSWWSFLPPRRSQVPFVNEREWVRNSIDAFIVAKLEEKGLTHAPRADKRTLVRRVYFDLIGLPPTPEQVEKFLNDSSSDAYEKLVDQLLESPRHGERSARRWLDVVRYADSAGYENDVYYPHAWRYRDYVIKSFNDDKPYDRFVQEQIAGDEIWPDTFELVDGTYAVSPEKLEYLEARIGTGLYTFGPEIRESNMNANKLLNERLTDAADTTGSVFMGLTLSCARCHDHKFDPFPQRDYYRLQAAFAGSQQVDIPVVTGISTSDHKRLYPMVIALDEARIAYRQFLGKVRKRIVTQVKAKFPPEVIRAYEMPKEKRTLEQEKLVESLENVVSSIKPESEMTPEEEQEKRDKLQLITEAVLAVPDRDGLHAVRYEGFYDVPTASVLARRDPELIPDIHVLERGDLEQKKEIVTAGLPSVLSDKLTDIEVPSEPLGLRARKKLALWLTSFDHPLTTRVMVNRIWQWYFGKGIVATPNDFGRMGQAPTHPELLDWLATEFVSQGWSLKAMHRLILLSSTYQMSSQYSNSENLRKDPENRYAWRMDRRRLEGEVLWDSMLDVAGTLNLKMGGRPVAPPLAKDELSSGVGFGWPVSADPAEHNRRGIYILARRNFTFPMFEVFDSPDTASSCPERGISNSAPQVLWSLNNDVVFRRAIDFAGRLMKDRGDNPSTWVEAAWHIALARPPSPQEKKEALQLITTFAREPIGKDDWNRLPFAHTDIPLEQQAALTKLCLAIFNLNEFIYVD